MKRVYVLDSSEIQKAYQIGDWRDPVKHNKLQAALSELPDSDLRRLLHAHRFQTLGFQKYLCADAQTALANKQKPRFFQKPLVFTIVGAIVSAFLTAVFSIFL